MVRIVATTLIFAAIASFALASPIGTPVQLGKRIDEPPCHTQTILHNLATNTAVSTGPEVLGTTCQNAQGATEGCTVGIEQGFEIGVEITIGSNLGLDIEGIGGGIDVSVAYSTSQSVSEVNTQPCPLGGAWHCGLAITKYYVQVDGTQSYATTGSCLSQPPNKSDAYSVQFPELDGQKLAKIDGTVCACPDYASWADAGAPPKCPGNCK